MASIGVDLQMLMATELIFLEPELLLTDLAARLSVSPHTLSQTLNMRFGQSFFKYVNSVRVLEVQRCFADAGYDSQSILEL